MLLTPSHEWGLQSDITPRFGARLVQEGNRLHYLTDRAGLIGSLTREQLKTLEQVFPLFIEQLEARLRSGELNSRQQHQVTVHLGEFTCIADTRASYGYVYIAIYPRVSATQ